MLLENYIGSLILNILNEEEFARVEFRNYNSEAFHVRVSVPHNGGILDFNMVRDCNTIRKTNEFVAEADALELLSGITKQKMKEVE